VCTSLPVPTAVISKAAALGSVRPSSFAVPSTSSTMDSPESNTPSAASTATLMSGTVPKMAYPQPPPAHAEIYRRLAVITSRLEKPR
jgi:hypothetical protein